MTKKNISTKSFDLDFVESCPDIFSWVNQFNKNDQLLAKLLLMNLEILPSDEYIKWLRQAIQELTENHKELAFYSVRKLDGTENKIWSSGGKGLKRTSKALGSEDLVNSTVANICKAGNHLNHPSIIELRKKKLKHIVLIDDAIGSGARVTEYLNAMFNNKSFLSWWSYGLIHIHIISYSRSHESKGYIVNNLPGTNHHRRKFKKKDKVSFLSKKILSREHQEAQWGVDYNGIQQLCELNPWVPSIFQLGFGGVMSNLIFSHSIPDNIPGILWWEDKNWAPLFPDRVVPNWLIEFVQGRLPRTTSDNISHEMLMFMAHIKKGIRDIHSISLRLNLDTQYAIKLQDKLIKSGLINEHNRLTKAGADFYYRKKLAITVPNYDRSLYIPSSW